MPNKILATFIGLDLLFAGTGATLIGVILAFRSGMTSASRTTNVATNLLLSQTPLEGTYPLIRVL